MPTQNPCLWFDFRAEEAAQHYVAIFPNSAILEVTRYERDMPGPEGAVLTVEFSLDGHRYTGLNGGPQFPFTEAVSFQVHCADQAEVDHYWTRLSEGGEQGPCGWLKDRFGVSWQVVPIRLHELMADPDRDRANRAVQAMLGMTKLDVAALERAADAGA